MAKQGPGRAALRAGSQWQPVVGGRLKQGMVAAGRPKQRVAGRSQLRLPRLRLPGLDATWRRAAVLTLFAVGVAIAGWWVYHSPMLSIRSVGVDGNSVLSEQQVQNIAALEGDSLLRPDFAGARARLLALPIVKDAHVNRDWPLGAHITVVERVPWGVWQAGGQNYVIDDEGVVLDRPPPAGAPVVVQSDAPPSPLVAGDHVDGGAIGVARPLVSTAQQTLGRQVLSLEFSQATGLTAVLSGDLRVDFGDATGYDFKLAALYAVLQQAQTEGKTLHHVDLRFGERVATQ